LRGGKPSTQRERGKGKPKKSLALKNSWDKTGSKVQKRYNKEKEKRRNRDPSEIKRPGKVVIVETHSLGA